MFLQPRYTVINSLRPFAPSLFVLSLIKCRITKIQNLASLVHLRVLWLSDNRIKKIEGLDGLQKLQRLYLEDNRISKIENLRLDALEVLWLQGNRVADVSGFGGLPSLRELRLDRNQVSRLARSELRGLLRLEKLTLSGNSLRGFREVFKLNAIPTLRHLVLNDPVQAPSLLPSLPNYHVIMVASLPHIASLDGKDVSEFRERADSIFSGKRLYYSIRATTADSDRSAHNLVWKAPIFDALREVETAIREAQRMLRDERAVIEGKRRARGAHEDKGFAGTQARLKQLQNSVSSLINVWSAGKEIEEELESEWQREGVVARALGTEEIEAGGNFRVEACGLDQRELYDSCSQLLETRHSKKILRALDKRLRDLSPQLTKIHTFRNRFLLAAFHSEISQIAVPPPMGMVETGQRYVEHVFLVEPWRFGKYKRRVVLPSLELAKIASVGPPLPSSYPFDRLPVTNSLEAAILGQLDFALKHAIAFRDSHEHALPSFRFSVLVMRAFIFKPEANPAQATSGSRLPPQLAPWKLGALSDAPFSYSADPAEKSRRIFFLPNSRLAVPEFLLDFVLDTSGGAICELVRRKSESTVGLPRGSLEQQNILICPERIAQLASQIRKMVQEADVLIEPASGLSKIQDFANIRSFLIDRSLESPELLTLIRRLDLHNGGVKNLPEISKFAPKLVELDLSSNEISSEALALMGVGALASLEDLNLADNCLTEFSTRVVCECVSLEKVSFSNLKTLSLAFNSIFTPRAVSGICLAPALRHLQAMGNPFMRSARSPAIFLALISLCPHLVSLDFQQIPRGKVGPPVGGVSEFSILEDDVGSFPSAAAQTSWGLFRTSAALAAADITHDLAERQEAYWKANKSQSHTGIRKSLNFQCAGITAIAPSAFSHAFEYLNLSSNPLVSFTGARPDVEHLVLRECGLESLEFLRGCDSLHRLDVSSNALQTLCGLDTCRRLRVLVAPFNFLEDVTAIYKLPELRELYLAGNSVPFSAVFHLTRITSLISLDLLWNPCIAGEEAAHSGLATDAKQISDFRSQFLFKAPFIRLLNRLPVSSDEVRLAQKEIGGRVTRAFIMSLLSPEEAAAKLAYIECLELEGTDVREFPDLTADILPSLRTVNLSANGIVSLDSLPRNLPPLDQLFLARNRLNARGLSFKARPFIVCPSLRELDLSENPIRAFHPAALSGITGLEKLTLSRAGLSSLPNAAFSSCARLRALDLSHNQLANLQASTFAGLRELVELDLSHNFLPNLSSLDADLPSLRILSFAGNRVTNQDGLARALQALPALSALTLQNNPVARKQMYRPLCAFHGAALLRLDGAPITKEERRRGVQIFGSSRSREHSLSFTGSRL
eukprot:gnl/Chilomastix_cuspidata/1990.p1 GENE.gnl/Chilomastix_cuspidata/1990~~gnl/Chilomastix_cuspidata/1990.p1  ORF type:complete len:1423 (-),score=340.21 gnl/Chilomastix_cuspidata/1990:3292-7350(-)